MWSKRGIEYQNSFERRREMIDNEKAIFLAGLKIDSEDEQIAYLDEACAGNPELRRRLADLLEAQRNNGGFLEQPPAAALAATLGCESASEQVGSVIGPYKLCEQIGEGGMGVVFVAEQTKPVRRKVALKIIQPGMDSQQVLSRFEAERQVLAIMDHPSIAKIYDAGSTDAGRPYFVMELVRGLPITEYCDRKQLNTNQRLKLFIMVCRAVQHAHQKGIIHRDLKPSNILVTIMDDGPLPKVIDFGVAKATSQQLTEQTLYTAHSQLIGTPLYMSPEQTEMTGFDIDTRSDVYSLGVLLYELLTGTTPFDKQTLQQVGFDEMRRIIREDEPPKPSARLSTLQAETLSTISERRDSDPRKLRQTLCGDLDWILMQALEKDRIRRYESASAFAADINRYLKHEPIEAKPPTLLDRVGKWSRRHTAIIYSAITILVLASVTLSVSTVVILSAYRTARQARNETSAALEDKTEALADRTKALNNETNALNLAEERFESSQRMTYNLQLSRMGELRRTDPTRARQILEDPTICPIELRDFTWRYYHRLTTNPIAVRSRFEIFFGFGPLVFSQDGKKIASVNKKISTALSICMMLRQEPYWARL